MSTLTPRYILGLVFLLIANFIWAGASVFQQYIYDDLDFSSPFVLTYIGTSVFILFLPIHEASIRLGWTTLKHQPAAYGFKEGFRGWMHYIMGVREGDSLDDSANGHLLRSEHKSGARISTQQRGDSAAAGDDAGMRMGGFQQGMTPMASKTKTEGGATNSSISEQQRGLPPAPYTHFQAFEIACMLGPCWFLSNLFYNYSLFWTTITSSTVLNNLAATFTLIMAWYAQIEHITYGKVMGVVASFLGGLVVTLHDSEVFSESGNADGDRASSRRALLGEQGSNMTYTLVGDAMSVLSAVMYSYYTVRMQQLTVDETEFDDLPSSAAGDGVDVYNPTNPGPKPDSTANLPSAIALDEKERAVSSVSTASSSGSGSGSGSGSVESESAVASRGGGSSSSSGSGSGSGGKVAVPFNLVLGYVGLVVVVTLFPVMLLQRVLCLEGMCKITAKALGCVLAMAVGANFFSEYLWARSMLLTTPTVATVGLSITIPLAYASDIIIGAPGAGSVVSGMGALLVIMGFVFVNVDDAFLAKMVQRCCSS
jgi:drug/metabolite transporter (DMT)-like permease